MSRTIDGGDHRCSTIANRRRSLPDDAKHEGLFFLGFGKDRNVRSSTKSTVATLQNDGPNVGVGRAGRKCLAKRNPAVWAERVDRGCIDRDGRDTVCRRDVNVRQFGGSF